MHILHILHILHIPLALSSLSARQHVFEPVFQFGCSPSLDVQDQLYTLQKSLQNCPDECHYDTQINGMHAIAHEHLMHTEVCNQPESIENQMCTTSRTSILIVCRVGSWAMKRAVICPFDHRLAGGMAYSIRQINSRCCFLNYTPSRISIFYSKPGIRQEITQSCWTAMTHHGSFARLAIMFLKYAKTYKICLNIYNMQNM